jgi:hypothetical protein
MLFSFRKNQHYPTLFTRVNAIYCLTRSSLYMQTYEDEQGHWFRCNPAALAAGALTVVAPGAPSSGR